MRGRAPAEGEGSIPGLLVLGCLGGKAVGLAERVKRRVFRVERGFWGRIKALGGGFACVQLGEDRLVG